MMRSEYNFKELKGRRNPHADRLKKQVTIRISTDVINYFKSMALREGLPYQSLMNLYLRDCVQTQRKLTFK